MDGQWTGNVRPISLQAPFSKKLNENPTPEEFLGTRSSPEPKNKRSRHSASDGASLSNHLILWVLKFHAASMYLA